MVIHAVGEYYMLKGEGEMRRIKEKKGKKRILKNNNLLVFYDTKYILLMF